LRAFSNAQCLELTSLRTWSCSKRRGGWRSSDAQRPNTVSVIASGGRTFSALTTDSLHNQDASRHEEKKQYDSLKGLRRYTNVDSGANPSANERGWKALESDPQHRHCYLPADRHANASKCQHDEIEWLVDCALPIHLSTPKSKPDQRKRAGQASEATQEASSEANNAISTLSTPSPDLALPTLA
jgi:hypothetical protein